LLVVEKVVEAGRSVGMARLLDDKVRRKQATVYWTRACCKQQTAMEVVDGAVMNTVSQVTAFVYAKVFATIPSSAQGVVTSVRHVGDENWKAAAF